MWCSCMNVKLVHISKNTTPMDVSVVVVGAGASGLVAAMAQFMHGMGFVRRCVLLTASKIQPTEPHMQICLGPSVASIILSP